MFNDQLLFGYEIEISNYGKTKMMRICADIDSLLTIGGHIENTNGPVHVTFSGVQ